MIENRREAMLFLFVALIFALVVVPVTLIVTAPIKAWVRLRDRFRRRTS